MTVTEFRPVRTAFGVLFFLVGAAFFLDSQGLVHAGAVDVWPLLLIAVGVAWLIGWARRRRVEEDRSAELTVAEERVRIARELHDVVAHGVSLMTIQITAARRVAASKPESAEQSLAAAEQAGRQTLSELDSMLAILRGADTSIGKASVSTSGLLPGRATPSPWTPARDPLPRLADIEGLVHSLRDAGRTIELRVLGEQPQVPGSVELVVYRVVQEALTNAVRYAGEATIEVQLIYTPDNITVFVDDNGTTPPTPTRPGGGHGLLGMSERLATVGGTLEFGPRTPGPGWRVHATVPLLALAA